MLGLSGAVAGHFRYRPGVFVKAGLLYIQRAPYGYPFVAMIAELRVGILLAWRSGFPALALSLLVAAVVIPLLAAQFSARQPATVALDVGFSFVRLYLPFIAVWLVQEMVSREVERRLHLTSLTYPRTRQVWLIGRFLSVAVLVGMLKLAAGALLVGSVFLISKGYPQSTAIDFGTPLLLAWLFSLVDLTVVTSAAILIAVLASTPGIVLIGGMGFMLIARSYAPIIQLLKEDGRIVEGVADPRLYEDSLSLLSMAFPDLGTLDIRMVALYGTLDFLPAHWPQLLIAVSAYAVAMLAIAAWMLSRRNYA